MTADRFADEVGENVSGPDGEECVDRPDAPAGCCRISTNNAIGIAIYANANDDAAAPG